MSGDLASSPYTMINCINNIPPYDDNNFTICRTRTKSGRCTVDEKRDSSSVAGVVVTTRRYIAVMTTST